MKSLRGVVFLCFTVFICWFINYGSATICKPFSEFHIDCNVCQCSRSGREYSCTDRRCPLRDSNAYLEEVNEDGYVLLKPKQTIKNDEEDFTLTRKVNPGFPTSSSNEDDN